MPFIIAKFVTNAHIFSPLNMSLITINTIINEIIAITNTKILNAKWLQIPYEDIVVGLRPPLQRVGCHALGLQWYTETNTLIGW